MSAADKLFKRYLEVRRAGSTNLNFCEFVGAMTANRKGKERNSEDLTGKTNKRYKVNNETLFEDRSMDLDEASSRNNTQDDNVENNQSQSQKTQVKISSLESQFQNGHACFRPRTVGPPDG